MTDAPERIWAQPPTVFDEMDVWHFEPRGEATEYIRVDLARPKVKPLVWEGDGHWHSGDNEGWMEEANTPFGWGYSIEFGINGYFKAESTFGWSQDGFDNPDEAKDAAQADYDRRILEALE
jgi:hypothetical protein